MFIALRHLAPILLAVPLAAAGQSLDDCRKIPGDAERLACYDGLANAGREDPPTSSADGKAPAASLLGKSWELDPDTRGRILELRAYKPVFLLPAFYASHANRHPASPAPGHTSVSGADIDNTEAKYQISLKSKLAEDLFGNNGDLWFGYTQSSHWQVFNNSTSRPFRETNYEPEAMLLWRTSYPVGEWRARYLGLGFNHQSNGRSLPLSRSWNRVIAAVALEKEDWTLTLRPWWRVPESAGDDDNPDISNYLGRAELQLVHRLDRQQFSLLLRHSLRSGANSHGAVQVDYAFPIAGGLRGHLQWFTGYGESLIDYNHRANYYGVGLSLLEWY